MAKEATVTLVHKRYAQVVQDWSCSACDEEFPSIEGAPDYCPNCGAEFTTIVPEIQDIQRTKKVRRQYVGWIYRDTEPGYKDHFSVHVPKPGAAPTVHDVGRGERGAAAAVAFFEEFEVEVPEMGNAHKFRKIAGLNLGPIKLERTPIGLRVFLPEESEKVVKNA